MFQWAAPPLPFISVAQCQLNALISSSLAVVYSKQKLDTEVSSICIIRLSSSIDGVSDD